MTHGTPGPGWPHHGDWWPELSYHDAGPDRTPLTEPGWGAAPVLAGVLLAGIALLGLDWVGDQGFADLSREVERAITEHTYLSDANALVRFYLQAGAVAVFLVGAVIPSAWTLGSIRWRHQARGLTRQSLLDGDVEPTRVLISVLAGLFLVFHIVCLLMLSDAVGRQGHFGPGPWLLVLGVALELVGAIIGPHVPERPAP